MIKSSARIVEGAKRYTRAPDVRVSALISAEERTLGDWEKKLDVKFDKTDYPNSIRKRLMFEPHDYLHFLPTPKKFGSMIGKDAAKGYDTTHGILHMINTANLALSLAHNYERRTGQKLDLDMIVSSSMLHDIGRQYDVNIDLYDITQNKIQTETGQWVHRLAKEERKVYNSLLNYKKGGKENPNVDRQFLVKKRMKEAIKYVKEAKGLTDLIEKRIREGYAITALGAAIDYTKQGSAERKVLQGLISDIKVRDRYRRAQDRHQVDVVQQSMVPRASRTVVEKMGVERQQRAKPLMASPVDLILNAVWGGYFPNQKDIGNLEKLNSPDKKVAREKREKIDNHIKEMKEYIWKSHLMREEIKRLIAKHEVKGGSRTAEEAILKAADTMEAALKPERTLYFGKRRKRRFFSNEDIDKYMDYSVNQNDIDTQAVLMYYMYGVLEQLDIPDAHDHLKKHETQIEEKIHRWMKKEIPKDLEKEYKNKVKAIKNRGYLEDKEKAYIESAKKKMIDRKTTELNYAKMTWLQYKNKKLIWIGKKVYPELTPFWGVIKEKDATGEAMDW